MVTIIPEFVLCTMLNRTFDFLRAEYDGQSDKTKSLIYALTAGPQGNLIGNLDRIKYYDEIVAILSKKKNEKRFLEVELMFNMKSETPPNIYISLPAEQPGQNGIGLDQGAQLPVIIEDPETYQGTWQATYTRRKNVTYNLVITSDNSNETIVLYHFIHAILLSLNGILDVGYGFENQRVSGGEVHPYADLVPKNIFTRVVSLYFEYDMASIDFTQYPLINQVVFIGTPIGDVLNQ